MGRDYKYFIDATQMTKKQIFKKIDSLREERDEVKNYNLPEEERYELDQKLGRISREYFRGNRHLDDIYNCYIRLGRNVHIPKSNQSHKEMNKEERKSQEHEREVYNLLAFLCDLNGVELFREVRTNLDEKMLDNIRAYKRLDVLTSMDIKRIEKYYSFPYGKKREYDGSLDDIFEKIRGTEYYKTKKISTEDCTWTTLLTNGSDVFHYDHYFENEV